jgi:hypothetical protein
MRYMMLIYSGEKESGLSPEEGAALMAAHG